VMDAYNISATTMLDLFHGVFAIVVVTLVTNAKMVSVFLSHALMVSINSSVIVTIAPLFFHVPLAQMQPAAPVARTVISSLRMVFVSTTVNASSRRVAPSVLQASV